MCKNYCHMRTLFSFGLTALLIMACFIGCTPDKGSAGLGALPKASFTVSQVSGATNTFAATASTTSVFSWYWDPGDGSGRVQGSANDTLYYAKKGNYRVTLTALGHGGYDTVSQIVQVASDDPGINILKGSDLTSSADWTVLNTGGTQTTFNFISSGLNISNTSSNTNGGPRLSPIACRCRPYSNRTSSGSDSSSSSSNDNNNWLRGIVPLSP